MHAVQLYMHGICLRELGYAARIIYNPGFTEMDIKIYSYICDPV